MKKRKEPSALGANIISEAHTVLDVVIMPALNILSILSRNNSRSLGPDVLAERRLVVQCGSLWLVF